MADLLFHIGTNTKLFVLISRVRASFFTTFQSMVTSSVAFRNGERDMKHIAMIAAITVAFSIATPTVAGDLDFVNDAMGSGDYEIAFNETLPLAENGNFVAMAIIGYVHHAGIGTEINDF